MILDVIVEDKKKRLPEHKKNISEIKMRELAEKYEGKKHGFYQALSKSGISIIGVLPKMDFPLSENLKMLPQVLEKLKVK